ncbi:SWIM zinc finger family protein [Haladaptatus salinisoli]|uniref:SWIM zinc finger family protein n=1 Tax=Haladaptatus salinisoli TaxID=2884876 RepID=UPI001D0A51C4|nr:SWIM zinc finger family protein [Haladaptatus salinisoli]
MTNTTASGKVSLAPLADTGEADPRSQRARAERMAVTTLGGGLYEVESQSDNTYFVDLLGGRCTCPDHMMRGVRCKHIRRVAIEINEGRTPPPGKEAVECARCDSVVFVDERKADETHFCDYCELQSGDAVVDRATGDLLIVVRMTDRRADEVEVPDKDCTIAEYPTNREYPADDPVVEVLYPIPSGLRPEQLKEHHLRRYSFPRSRLKYPERPSDQSELTDFPEPN